MHTEASLNALGTPFEIRPEVLAQCERFDADLYSDLHKDAYGFRPRAGLGDRTAAQLDALWDNIIRDKNAALDYEREQEAVAVARWDARMDALIDMGAGDYPTAVRWALQAEGEDDLDLVLWMNGVNDLRNVARIRDMAGL